MTTVAGRTVPPLFGGASLPIFLRDTGAWFNTDDSDGHPNTPLPLPTRQAGDQLYVFSAGVGATASPVEIANWTAQTGTGGGSLSLWRRVATNTAADNFTVPASFTGMSLNQMASFGNENGSGLTFDTGGSTFDFFVGNWPMLALPATGSNVTLVLALYMRARATLNPVPTVTDNTGLDIVGLQARAQGVRTIWSGWSWRFDATPQTAPAIEQGYTPTPVNATVITRYMRFRQI